MLLLECDRCVDEPALSALAERSQLETHRGAACMSLRSRKIACTHCAIAVVIEAAQSGPPSAAEKLLITCGYHSQSVRGQSSGGRAAQRLANFRKMSSQICKFPLRAVERAVELAADRSEYERHDRRQFNHNVDGRARPRRCDFDYLCAVWIVHA